MQWAAIIPFPNSITEQIGYISVQADLSDGTGDSITGGSVRNFPKPGSNPPGIIVHMNLNPITKVVTGCGTFNVDPSVTKYFEFPMVTVTIHDKTSFGGSYVIPGTAFVDTLYSVSCGVINPVSGSFGHFFGELTITSKTTNTVNWHFEQEIGDYVPPGTVLHANCMAYHP